ncbi:hypothetical protein J6590_023257 [Homalodisca vitripennis]|nr:hypothetical protein J6590_023257 [Homalodisca vitripennis]
MNDDWDYQTAVVLCNPCNLCVNDTEKNSRPKTFGRLTRDGRGYGQCGEAAGVKLTHLSPGSRITDSHLTWITRFLRARTRARYLRKRDFLLPPAASSVISPTSEEHMGAASTSLKKVSKLIHL